MYKLRPGQCGRRRAGKKGMNESTGCLDDLEGRVQGREGGRWRGRGRGAGALYCPAPCGCPQLPPSQGYLEARTGGEARGRLLVRVPKGGEIRGGEGRGRGDCCCSTDLQRNNMGGGRGSQPSLAAPASVWWDVTCKLGGAAGSGARKNSGLAGWLSACYAALGPLYVLCTSAR